MPSVTNRSTMLYGTGYRDRIYIQQPRLLTAPDRRVPSLCKSGSAWYMCHSAGCSTNSGRVVRELANGGEQDRGCKALSFDGFPKRIQSVHIPD
jgi:hypothetical protein